MMSLRNLISLGFNSPQLAAVKSVQSTFRYLAACREVVHLPITQIFKSMHLGFHVLRVSQNGSFTDADIIQTSFLI